MARFRRIPSFIEAHRIQKRTLIGPSPNGHQGMLVAYPGDYLCVDSQGHAFFCSAEEFKGQYEPIEEQELHPLRKGDDHD
jgi:hypothetical protein